MVEAFDELVKVQFTGERTDDLHQLFFVKECMMLCWSCFPIFSFSWVVVLFIDLYCKAPIILAAV